tara:strand:+ start:68 stop:817 length:750 start_codon:yes stop_codon:yes gene_type:complete
MSEKLSVLTKKLNELETIATKKIKNTNSSHELDQLKSQFIGKKSDLAAILKDVSQLPNDEKPMIGKLANTIKTNLLSSIQSQKEIVTDIEQNQKLQAQQSDVTLPTTKTTLGAQHPINTTINHLVSIFNRLGFSVKKGPDIETDFYNFEALNIPEHHPARDMHDTFYVKSGDVLRTHTSPVQIRTMLDQKPPIKIIAPGKVYRCDADTSHSPVFHQIEGLYVDKGVRFSDLKGILEFFLKELFGQDKSV